MDSWTGALISFFIFLVCIAAIFGVEVSGYVILCVLAFASLTASVFVVIGKLDKAIFKE